jgi:hypothetical protein
MSPERVRLEAEQVLYNLWSEKLLPFKLSARKVESTGVNGYLVRFYDSRFHSIDVSLSEGESFRETFTTAVLHHVSVMRFSLQERA